MSMCGAFLVFCLVLGCRSEGLTSDRENSNKLYESEWQCDTVCAVSGGRAEFNLENKICKCALERDVDDIDANLMLKNSAASGLHMLIIQPKRILDKREADTASEALNESLVGAQRSIFTTPKPHKPILPTKKGLAVFRKKINLNTKKPHIKTSLTTQKRMKDIERRLAEMRKAIARNNPLLGQRAGFAAADSKTDLLKQIKDKHQEILDKIRSASTLHSNTHTNNRIITSPVIGSPSKANEDDKPPNNDLQTILDLNSNFAKVGNSPRFELITQDPSLYKNND